VYAVVDDALSLDPTDLLVHRGLCDNEWVVLEAGTHVRSVRLRTAALVGVSHAELADLVQN
jgi:prolyl-tRNA editing enzyme YbaK/EbsC (Cys-tRNA(Pro) deacylase)